MTTSIKNRAAKYTKFNGRKKAAKVMARRILRARDKAALRANS